MATEPGLARAVELLGAPPISLGSYPTAVDRLPTLERNDSVLWVKRDDLTGDVYGGSKVRKLEYLLAEARRRGKKKILTMGAVGSHHVLATSVYGKLHGFEVGALLVPQPRTPHVVMNVRADLAQGLHATAASYATLPLRAWLAMDDDTYFVTLGGSSPLGSLGYVAAAVELAAQIERGELQTPDRVYVALGSGGTAAGLAVGLALAGVKTRVVAVAVSKPVFVLRFMVRRLVRKVARACGVDEGLALAGIEVDGRWVGDGYGYATTHAARAIDHGCEAGILLDATYTGKAFGAALARMEETGREKILFWHTLSSRPLEPLLGAGAGGEVPEDISRLMR